MGDSKVDGDGGEVDGDGGDGDGDQWRWLRGHFPIPAGVPKLRLPSPKICLQWRRRCGTILGKTLIPLGFSVPRLYIGEGVIRL
jgi:hypothetical protein